MSVEAYRAAREAYAAAPSHYLDVKPAHERDCVCIIEAFADQGIWHEDFKDFVGVHGLGEWNATHTTEDVLAKLDAFIETLAS